MKRALSFLLACFMLHASCFMLAAEPETFNRKALIRTARTYAKADNYTKVDETLTQAFNAYPEARADAELVHLQMQAQQQLFLAENKKIFLNSKPDTAAYFQRAAATMQYALLLDSIEQLPNHKGRIKTHYEKETAERLRQHMPNLLSAGKYHYKKADYASAYPLFLLWLNARANHLIAHAALTADSIAVARLSVLSAFAAEDYEQALRYIHLAQQDSTARCALMEMEARAHHQLKRNNEMIDIAQRANQDYPAHDFFAITLITHYDSTAHYPQALAVIQRAIDAGGSPKQYAYLSGRIYESMNRLDSAAICYEQALAHDSLDANVQAAAGLLALKQAAQIRNNTNALQLQQPQIKAQLTQLYHYAATHLEQARDLAPQQPQLWKNGLKEVYFRQGRGSDLQLIDRTP